MVEVKKKTTVDIDLSEADILSMIEKYILSHKTELDIGRGTWRLSGGKVIKATMSPGDVKYHCTLVQVDDA